MPSPDPDFERLVRRTTGLQPWRRLFHALSGVSLAGVPVLLEWPRSRTAILLSAGFVLALTLDLLRLHRPGLNRLFFRSFRLLASPREARGVASSSWFLLGAALAWALFPAPYAVAGLLVLALADPAASLVGRTWGTFPLGTGSLQGSLAFFGTAWGVLAVVTGEPGAAAGVAAGVTAVEVLPGPVDDNLAVPLSTGAFLWLVLGIPGGP